MKVKNGPSAMDKYVGQRLRIRRLMIGLSQTTVADHLNITFQQVQKYEKGINRIGSGRLAEIANLLKVPISYFYEGGPTEIQNGKDTVPNKDLVLVNKLLTDPQGMRMVRAYLALDPIIQLGSVRLFEKIVEQKQ
jgi:transcriptional regulator with XRE-family HTH domain